MIKAIIALEIAIARSQRRLEDLKRHDRAPLKDLLKPIKEVLPNLNADIMVYSVTYSDDYYRAAVKELSKYIRIIEKVLSTLHSYPAIYAQLKTIHNTLIKATDMYDYFNAYGLLLQLGE